MKSKLKYILVLVLVVPFILACATNSPQPKSEPSLSELRKLGPAAEVKVKVLDNYYDPKKIQVKPNTIVIWKNDGNIAHNMVVYKTTGKGNEKFTSPIISPGVDYAKKFTKKSIDTTYYYYCTIHGKTQSGEVSVGS